MPLLTLWMYSGDWRLMVSALAKPLLAIVRSAVALIPTKNAHSLFWVCKGSPHARWQYRAYALGQHVRHDRGPGLSLHLDGVGPDAIAERIGPSVEEILGPGPAVDPELIAYFDKRDYYRQPAENEQRFGEIREQFREDAWQVAGLCGAMD
jgi:hypothetical protein